VADRWATFDCYGTLIDWEAGLRDAYESVWPELDRERALRLHHALEPLVEERGELTYREVLARCLAGVGALEGREPPPGRAEALADSLPSWSPFPEVPAALTELRDRGWRLAILSNTDPDLLAASVEAIGVPFELTITEREAESYKPAPGHWERFLDVSGADRDRHVHVAASLYHDIEPCSRMGIPAVWINRLGEASDLPRAAELPDLAGLPQTLDGLAATPAS
jgi:2-haloacid dehalogenase